MNLNIIEEFNNEINDFFDSINKNDNNNYYLNKHYLDNNNDNDNDNNNDNNKLKIILNKLNEETILKLKHTIYINEFNETHINKILIRINKNSGKIYNYVKIVNINNNILHIKSLNGNKIKIIDSNYYFCFILKYNNLNDYLKSFLSN